MAYDICYGCVAVKGLDYTPDLQYNAHKRYELINDKQELHLSQYHYR